MQPALVRRYYRLTLAVAVGVAVVQGLLIVVAATLYRDAAAQRMATVGLATAAVMFEDAAASGRPWPEVEQRLRARLADVGDSDEIAAYDEGGRLLLRTTGRLPDVPPDLRADIRARLDQGPRFLDESGALLLVAGAARDVGGRRYYLVRLDNILGAVLPGVLPLGLLAIVLPMVLLAGAGGILILRITTRQLAKVDRVLRLMSSGDLSARLSLPVDPDTAGVVLSFNRMAEQVETTIEKLRQSDEGRRQLLADVTHELNTPLTSVLGYLETLTMEDLPLPEERRRQLTQIAYEEAVNLRALIEDLTTLSRLDAEGLPIERVRVAVSPIVERVLRRLSQLAEQRGVPLVAELAEGVEIKGDPQRIDQVVRNLVENALRHTSPPGDVRVVVRSDGMSAIIEVIDRGPGMPPEALAKIGQRFLRLDKSRARNTGGRGLGLAISVGLVQMHGGRVDFESELGSGTRVRVALPLLGSGELGEVAADPRRAETSGVFPSVPRAAVAGGPAATATSEPGRPATTEAATTAAAAAAPPPGSPSRS